MVIIGDNDEIGRQYTEEEACKIAPVAASVKVLDLRDIWADMPEHGDISDYIAKFGDGALKNVETLADNTPVWSEREQRDHAAPEQEAVSPLKIFSAKELLGKYIAPTEFIVNALLPTGFALLASPPKYGKSWLALDLCILSSLRRLIRRFVPFHKTKSQLGSSVILRRFVYTEAGIGGSLFPASDYVSAKWSHRYYLGPLIGRASVCIIKRGSYPVLRPICPGPWAVAWVKICCLPPVPFCTTELEIPSVNGKGHPQY